MTMKAMKVLLLVIMMPSIFSMCGGGGGDGEGGKGNSDRMADKPPAGEPLSFFQNAYREGLLIKIEGDVASLYVIDCWFDNKEQNYKFVLNFLVAPADQDGSLSKIKGMSLYIFSDQPEPSVKVSYDNTNEWTHLSAYQPAAADQIINEYGGPNSFYGLDYAWLIGASFVDITYDDLGVILLSAPAETRLKFILRTYIVVPSGLIPSD